MADFIFTSPTGEKFKVSGPDEDGAIQAFERFMAEESKPTAADRIAAAKAGTLEASPESLATAQQADQRAQDQMTIAGAGGTIPALSTKAAQGLPFVGEWIDEGFNAIDPGRGDRLRQIQEATGREMPKSSLAAQIGGGVVGSVPLAIGAVGAVGRAATTAGKVLGGTGLGIVAGGTEGALQGAGAANEGNRGRGAATGAAIGAGMGGVVGMLAPVVSDGVQAIARRVKKLDVRTIADEFGLSIPAARTVKSALANDDMERAIAAIRRGGDDAMLADAGPASRQMLDAASQTGGEALAITRDRVGTRAATQGARFKQTIDDVLGTPGGVRAAARDISQRTAPARQAAYDRAFASPIDYSGPGRNIEAVLERIPPRTLKSAIDEANEAMIAEGKRNMQILADIADDGSVTFREMPNVQQLNQIKIELGNIAQGEVDQFGRKTARGVRASKLAAELRDAVGEAVPSYRTALKLGGDKIAEDNALDLGRNLLTKRTTFEDVRDGLRGASDEAKAAAKRGLRENLDSIMENARTTLTEIEAGNFDFETGQNAAKEALDALRNLTTPANFKKARLVLGSDAKRLFDELQKTSDAMALRAAVAKNTATAVRSAIRQQVTDETAPGVLRRVVGNMGNPLDAAKDVTQTIAGIDPASMSEAQRQLFAEIADALTGIRGAEAERAMRAVQGAMQGQPIRDAEAEIIGRLVAGTLAAGGYQGGTQANMPSQPLRMELTDPGNQRLNQR